jgi:hypothetical protein
MSERVVHEPHARPPGEQTLGEVLTAALARRRMSLTHLQARLHDRGYAVSMASLSYWRSGKRRPESAESLDALSEIEAILDLPAGRLRDARGPSRRPGPRLLSVADVVPADVPVDDALTALDLADWSEHLVEEAVHIAADVDENGAMVRSTCRMMLRAVTDGAQHYPLYVFAGQPVPEPLRLEHVAGASVTGHVEEDTVGLSMWRLTLPRPLQAGETALIESTVHLAGGVDAGDEWIHHTVRRLNELTVWVRFDERRVPSGCELVVEAEDGVVHRTPVDVAEMHSAHLSLRRFGPGRAGVAFTW